MTACGDVIDRVAVRVRDTAHTAYDIPTCLLLLSHAERIVNTALLIVKKDIEYELKPYRQLYGKFSWELPEAARIIQVFWHGRMLPRAPWERLHHFDPQWLRRVGPEPQVWDTVGRDGLLVHPGLPVATPIKLAVAVLPPTLTVTQQALTIPDQELPTLEDVFELLLLTTGREFGLGWQTAYKRVQERFGVEIKRNRSSSQPIERPGGPERD